MQYYDGPQPSTFGDSEWQNGPANVPGRRPTRHGPETQSEGDLTSSDLFGPVDPVWDFEHDAAAVPDGGTATDRYRDSTSQQSSPTDIRLDCGPSRTFPAEYDDPFEAAGLADDVDYSGLAAEQLWYPESTITGTAERYAPPSGSEQAPWRLRCEAWPSSDNVAFGFVGGYREPPTSYEYAAPGNSASWYAPQWINVSAGPAPEPYRGPTQTRLLPAYPPDAFPAVGHASSTTPTSTHAQAVPILPPLPASPPLSAASYSLSPSGPTLSSFASMSIGPAGGYTGQPFEYTNNNPWGGGRPQVPDHGTQQGYLPSSEWFTPASRAPSAFRQFDVDGNAQEAPTRIKLEEESSPELPPSPVDPFSNRKARARATASTSAKPAGSFPVSPTDADVFWYSPDSLAVPEDLDEEEEEEEQESTDERDDSPEWLPASSSPRGRSAPRRKHLLPSSSDARPRPSRPPPPPPPPQPSSSGSKRRGGGGGGAGKEVDRPPRISPITGQPVKLIAKRVYPPRDAHKRRFVCEVEGCGKTFGRPSARNTHMRSHSGQKPFTCPIPRCARSFSVFSNLKRHMVMHPTVDFRHVTVHDLPLMRWVPYQDRSGDEGGTTAALRAQEEAEGGRLEWIEDLDEKGKGVVRVKVEEMDEEDVDPDAFLPP
ncbi:hypothetical protein JCM8115_003063 [Rhodotorula mucilaginosa]